MRSIVHTALAAATFAVAVLPVSGAGAMPAIPLAKSAPAITLTSGGCGPFRHRGFYGFCRPNGVGPYGVGYRYGWRGYGWHRWGGWHRW